MDRDKERENNGLIFHVRITHCVYFFVAIQNYNIVVRVHLCKTVQFCLQIVLFVMELFTSNKNIKSITFFGGYSYRFDKIYKTNEVF